MSASVLYHKGVRSEGVSLSYATSPNDVCMGVISRRNVAEGVRLSDITLPDDDRTGVRSRVCVVMLLIVT